MFKKIILFITLSIMVIPATVKADEGMWFLMFIERLNHRDMQKMGLQLTAEEIYSINNHSLKDAIVQFNGGCTAEIVSSQGLVLTNHHCGYDAIAELSSEEQNYLKNGFWAATKKDEMKPKSLYVRFFVRMDDVSKRMLARRICAGSRQSGSTIFSYQAVACGKRFKVSSTLPRISIKRCDFCGRALIS